jgi:hypothetical protein
VAVLLTRLGASTATFVDNCAVKTGNVERIVCCKNRSHLTRFWLVYLRLWCRSVLVSAYAVVTIYDRSLEQTIPVEAKKL